MSLQVIETGEVVDEMSRVEAERITSRIADKLDTIADNLEQVLPLIGEALTREAWRALDYASPTAYVSERFAGALTRLPVEVRRPVVAQLSAAGMSTRSIAPIVGTTHKTVVKDTQALRSQVVPEVPPAPLADEPGQVIKLTGANSVASPNEELPKSENIIGADGKEYKRPEPVEQPAKPKRRPITDQARDAGWEIRKATEKLQRIFNDDRLNRNKEEVATHLRGHLEYAIETLQGFIDTINDK